MYAIRNKLIAIVHGELQRLTCGRLLGRWVDHFDGTRRPGPPPPVRRLLRVGLVVDVDLLLGVGGVVAQPPDGVVRREQLVRHQSLEGTIFSSHLQQKGGSRRTPGAMRRSKRRARGGSGRVMRRGRQAASEHRRLAALGSRRRLL